AAGLGHPEGTGQFVALLGEKSGVMFVFVGRAGRRPIAGVGRYDLTGDRVTILHDTAALEQATGLSAALVLARMDLLPGEPPTLWVRDLDRSIMLSVGGTVPQRRMDRLLDDAGAPVGGRGPEMSATLLGRRLTLLDPLAGRLYRIGDAAQLVPLQALHEDCDYPANLASVRGDGAEWAIVATVRRPPERARRLGMGMPIDPGFALPAMVLSDGRTQRVIDRDALRLPPGVPPDLLHPTRLAGAPDGTSFLLYDANTGQLLRGTPAP
ncbi:MAG TPA: hypothetical protein PKB10_04795, partial [Tepidisphaeraceae bacterium]|nr:hypothetical protein [Tepidisphaeraceae bacterium]